MIDPELAAYVEAMPVFDLNDPVAARAGFEAMVEGMARDLPQADTLDIDDRMIPGWDGRSGGQGARVPAEGRRAACPCPAS